MKKKSKQVKEEDEASALVSKGLDDSDVEEDRNVDLSSVPTPKIGFKMPNLSTTNEGLKQLTPNALNNYIVKMRPVVDRAKYFVEGQLRKKIKFIEKKSEKTISEKEKLYVQRWKEDIQGLKKIPNDDVSKFALANKKGKNELSLSATIPVAERCLYQLAMAKPLQKMVQEYRKTYSDCDARTGYFLQRLGHKQAEAKKVEKPLKTSQVEQKQKIKNLEETEPDNFEESDIEASENEEDVEDSETPSEEEVSDVEMGSGSEDEEELAKRRKILFDLCGIKEDKFRPKIAPKPKKNIPSDEEEDHKQEVNDQDNIKDITQNVLKRTLKEQKIKGNKVKQIKADLKQVKEAKRPLEIAPELVSSTRSVIKKVKLSDGGIIKLDKKKSVAKEIAKKETDEENDEESDDDAASSGFFLGERDTRNNSSGEESGADEDFEISRIKTNKKERPAPTKPQKQKNNKNEKRAESRMIQLNKKPLPNPKDSKTLHPSWAAKVEKKKQMENMKPQGKRTVFADDD